jgi:hypothetical protein
MFIDRIIIFIYGVVYLVNTIKENAIVFTVIYLFKQLIDLFVDEILIVFLNQILKLFTHKSLFLETENLAYL